MRITVHGAAGGEVTGSAYLIETNQSSVLVDFGMFQGSKATERLNALPARWPKKLDAVVLTHAHLDHTGRLPLIPEIRGRIYATEATRELTQLILSDSAKVQRYDIEKKNRRLRRQGKREVEPLYEKGDVDRLMPLFADLSFKQAQEVARGVRVRAVDAGHMLGSASLEVTVEENGQSRTIVFSGDIGPRNAPILRDATPFNKADVLFMESTYGDRDHRSLAATIDEAIEAIRHAISRRGKILIPTFAIGRTQLLLYLLAGAVHRGEIPAIPVFIDSPMAIEATRIYDDHVELYDEEALALYKAGVLDKHSENVTFCQTAEESKALNDVDGPCVIMAGSGMCTAGRILHHLRHNLSRRETTVLIVGYQGEGSLGRALVDRHATVKIFGEMIPVHADVRTLGGFSGHAGQTDLIHWYSTLAPSNPTVYLTHGEDRARHPLARLLREKFHANVNLPSLGQVVELM